MGERTRDTGCTFIARTGRSILQQRSELVSSAISTVDRLVDAAAFMEGSTASSQSGGRPVNWVDYNHPAASGTYRHSPSRNISCSRTPRSRTARVNNEYDW